MKLNTLQEVIKVIFNNTRKSRDFALAILEIPELAKLSDETGWSVAQTAARFHDEAAIKVLKKPELAKLSNKIGWSVAHTAAERCKKSAEFIIYNYSQFKDLPEKDGISVIEIARMKLN